MARRKRKPGVSPEKLDEVKERDIPVMDEEEFASFLRERGADVRS